MITRKALKTSIAPMTKQPTSEQAQYHRNDADQPEFQDQAFKPTFNPSRRHGPTRSSVRSLIKRISGLGCDTFRDPIKVLSATSANSQDSKNGGFYLPHNRDIAAPFLLQKTIVLMAFPVVHGQSRGGLWPAKPFENLGFQACVPAIDTGTQ